MKIKSPHKVVKATPRKKTKKNKLALIYYNCAEIIEKSKNDGNFATSEQKEILKILKKTASEAESKVHEIRDPKDHMIALSIGTMYFNVRGVDVKNHPHWEKTVAEDKDGRLESIGLEFGVHWVAWITAVDKYPYTCRDILKEGV